MLVQMARHPPAGDSGLTPGSGGFCLLGVVPYSVSLLEISLFIFSFLPCSVSGDGTFLRICPCLLGYLFHWLQLFVAFFYDPLYFCGVGCSFIFFISDFIHLGPLPFFLHESG